MNNQWNSYLRSRKPHDVLDEQLGSEESGPFEQCEITETVYRVRRAVSTLPIIERQVITLVDLEELSYCDTAEALGIPIGTVMSRLHRARKRLLEKVEAAEKSVPARMGNICLVE